MTDDGGMCDQPDPAEPVSILKILSQLPGSDLEEIGPGMYQARRDQDGFPFPGSGLPDLPPLV